MALKVAAVVGAGPGIGFSVAKRFATEGFNIALVSRSAEKLTNFAEKIRTESKVKVLALSADAAQPQSVSAAFKQVRAELGKVDVLIYNVAYFKRASVMDTPLQDYEQAFQAITLGAISTTKEVLQPMIDEKSGTIIFTGATASLRGGAGFSAFASAKFALRAFAQSLAREAHPQGVHVAHVIIDGVVNVPGSAWIEKSKAENGEYIEPEAVAEAYYQLYKQPRTAWSHEFEIRPYSEKF